MDMNWWVEFKNEIKANLKIFKEYIDFILWKSLIFILSKDLYGGR